MRPISLRPALALMVALGLGCKPSDTKHNDAGGSGSVDAVDASPDAADAPDGAPNADGKDGDADATPIHLDATVANDASADASDVFNPNAGMPPGYSWKHMAPMHVARYAATAVWGDGYLYVCGGRTKFGCCQNKSALPPKSDGLEASIERYDMKTDTWELLPMPPVYPEEGTRYVWGAGRLFVYTPHDPNLNFSGPTPWTATPVTAAMYDPKLKAWTALPEQNSPGKRWIFAAAWTGKELFIWGSFKVVPSAPAATFDPETMKWTPLPPAPSAAVETDHPSAAIWTGKRVVLVTSKVGLEYDPNLKAWSTFPRAPGPEVEPGQSAYRFFIAKAPIDGGFIGMTQRGIVPYNEIWTHKDGAQSFEKVDWPDVTMPPGPRFAYAKGVICLVQFGHDSPSESVHGGACRSPDGKWLAINNPTPEWARAQSAIASQSGMIAFVGGVVGDIGLGPPLLGIDGWLLQVPKGVTP